MWLKERDPAGRWVRKEKKEKGDFSGLVVKKEDRVIDA